MVLVWGLHHACVLSALQTVAGWLMLLVAVEWMSQKTLIDGECELRCLEPGLARELKHGMRERKTGSQRK